MSIFSSVKAFHFKKNAFNLSNDNMLSLDMGQLVPCFVMDTLQPNSKLRVSVAQISQFQALLAPVKHKVDSYIHFYKIPFRLIDPDFPNFISGKMMRDNEDYDPPYFSYYGLFLYGSLAKLRQFVSDGKLLDYLGYPIIDWSYISDHLPQGVADLEEYCSLLDDKLNIRRIQAYLYPLYYSYINQNVIPEGSLLYQLVDLINQFCKPEGSVSLHGDVSELVYTLLDTLSELNSSQCFPHAWFKDYFTSALPFVQVGDPVTFGMTGTAPVTSKEGGLITIEDPDYNIANAIDASLGEDALATANLGGYTHIGKQGFTQGQTIDAGDVSKRITGEANLNDLDLQADLSEASAITVNELRIAVALQSLKEAYARFGTRFNEWLQGFWNEKPKDATLQMPQYLGGGKVPIMVSDVEQTSASSNSSLEADGTPLGTLAGNARGVGMFKAFTVHIDEPSIVIGYLFIQPKSMYGNRGLDRNLLKLNDLFDYFNPKTEHLGEQALRQSELYYGAYPHGDLAPGSHSNTDVTFGYSPRYAEYRYRKNEIHGQFMNYLNFWHFGRISNGFPTLSPEFIYTQNEEVKRPFAVQEVEGADVASVMMWLHFEVHLITKMSKFGTPMLMN